MTNRIHKDAPDAMFPELKIRTLLIRESDGERELWVMQGLELDIVAQAPTIPEVKNRFTRMILSHIIMATETGTKPFENLKPAPKECWDRYEEGLDLRDAFSLAIPGDEIPEDLPPSRMPRGEALVRIA
jgi:hypothetical protein